jgi:hypothetical protein
MEKVPSVNELYETILRRSVLPLPGLEDPLVERAWERANRIHDYLLDRSDRLDTECSNCGDRLARRSFTRYVFETPCDNEEVEKGFCSADCETSYLYGGDFAYFTCHRCEREIC